jgi:hypothetical protein
LQALNLIPGENTILSEFHYNPDDANDTTAQSFLSDFIQTGDTLPLSIKGDSSSSPYPSLLAALEGASVSASLVGKSGLYCLSRTLGVLYLSGLKAPAIITHINAYIPLSALFDNLIVIDFDVSLHPSTPLECHGLTWCLFAHLLAGKSL